MELNVNVAAFPWFQPYCNRMYHSIVLVLMLSKLLSCVQLFETLWTVAHQALLSMEFSRQEYWSGLSFPPPGDLPDPGIEVGTPESQADSLPSEPPGKSLSHSFNSGQFESRENCRTRV